QFQQELRRPQLRSRRIAGRTGQRFSRRGTWNPTRSCPSTLLRAREKLRQGNFSFRCFYPDLGKRVEPSGQFRKWPPTQSPQSDRLNPPNELDKIPPNVPARVGVSVRTLSAKWPTAHAKLVEDKANGTA